MVSKKRIFHRCLVCWESRGGMTIFDQSIFQKEMTQTFYISLVLDDESENEDDLDDFLATPLLPLTPTRLTTPTTPTAPKTPSPSPPSSAETKKPNGRTAMFKTRAQKKGIPRLMHIYLLSALKLHSSIIHFCRSFERQLHLLTFFAACWANFPFICLKTPIIKMFIYELIESLQDIVRKMHSFLI